MSKYIDADKLIAEIERLMNGETRGVALKSVAYKNVISLITSLQQEQPEQEWSEKDELMRERCIVDLGYLTEYEPQYKERYDAQIDWLKSLLHRFNKRKEK